MKNIRRMVISLLVLSLALAWVPQVKADDTLSLNAMTYNIKNSNYSFSGVRSMITTAGADIVGMQEVSAFQLGFLTSSMSSAGFTILKGSGRDSSELNTEYNPIFYNADKFTLHRGGTFWLSDTGSVESAYEGSACYRICTWGYFQVVNTDKYFIVFNTHTDYTSADIVVKQLNCILKQIVVKTDELTNARDHVILMGDMNTVSNYTVCKYLQGDTAYNGVYNPYTMQRLDETRQIADTVTLNSFGNYYTQPAENPTSDLDHIYVTSKGFHCTRYQVLSNAAGSDHLPIMASLQWRNEHHYTYEYLENGSHLASCDHCGDSYEESCTIQNGHCAICGCGSGKETFALVTEASQLTSGRYVVLAAAVQGSYTGDYGYYAMTLQQDSGFNALSGSGFDYTSRPDTIALEGSQLGELVWTLEGTTSGFTLRGNGENALYHDGQGLYYGNYTPTTWTAGHSTSNLHCAVKYNGSSYLSLRTDMNTLDITDRQAPLFSVAGNTDTGNYKMFFYKSEGICAHESTKTQTVPATCTEEGSVIVTCTDCSAVISSSSIPAHGHEYKTVAEGNVEIHTCIHCGDSYETVIETEPTEPEVTEPVLGEGQWVKVELPDIQSTDTVAITMSKEGATWLLPNTGAGSKKQPLADITGIVSGNTLSTAADASTVSWNIIPAEGGYHIVAGGSYLYSTADNNGIRIGKTEAVWNIVDNYLSVADTGGTTRYLGVYSGTDWRSYTTIGNNIKGQTLAFWKLMEATIDPNPTEPEPTEPSVNPNAKNGIYLEDGKYYYYINDEIQYAAGLVEVNGDYYYIRSGGYAAIGSYWCTNTNGITAEGFYIFAEDGKMILTDESKTGIYLEDGKYYYYIDGEIQFGAGLVMIDGSYYYIRSGGYAAIGSYWVTNTNGITAEGFYIFAEDGKMILTDTSKNGIYLEDGLYYYYKDGEIQFGAGLVLVEGSYYYIRSGGYAAIGAYYVSITNGLLPEGTYTFGIDGKMLP